MRPVMSAFDMEFCTLHRLLLLLNYFTHYTLILCIDNMVGKRQLAKTLYYTRKYETKNKTDFFF